MNTTEALDELFRMDESAFKEPLRGELEVWRVEYQEFYKWIGQEAAPSSATEQQRLRDGAAQYELPAAKTFVEWSAGRATDNQLLEALRACINHYGGRRGV
jgi:hypothetical protein